jgi:hypothetical protein
MIGGKSVSLKTLCPLLLIIAYVPVAAYSGFSSVVAVWSGFRHIHHANFWVPILAGLILLAAVSWISLFVARRVFSNMRERGFLPA